MPDLGRAPPDDHRDHVEAASLERWTLEGDVRLGSLPEPFSLLMIHCVRGVEEPIRGPRLHLDEHQTIPIERYRVYLAEAVVPIAMKDAHTARLQVLGRHGLSQLTHLLAAHLDEDTLGV